jgi:hypothetical protein
MESLFFTLGLVEPESVVMGDNIGDETMTLRNCMYVEAFQYVYSLILARI